VHADLVLPVYRQRFVFLLDHDLDRGNEWLNHLTKSHVELGVIREPAAHAAAFRVLDEHQVPIFVLWVKHWTETANDYAGLAHEAVHTAISVLTHCGFTPKMKPSNSEPLCYLVSVVMLTCLEAIHAKQSQSQS
jgi:hypothetical protein